MKVILVTESANLGGLGDQVDRSSPALAGIS